MKASLLAMTSTCVATAGLIHTLPVPIPIENVGLRKFPVGEKPSTLGTDSRKTNKVLTLPLKIKADKALVLLTKPNNPEKGIEMMRGKNKIGEKSHESANREALEEGGVWGITDEKTKVTVEHDHPGKQAKEYLDAHIVQVPWGMKKQDLEERKNRWVNTKKAKEMLSRPEHKKAYEELEKQIKAIKENQTRIPPKFKAKSAKKQAAASLNRW